MLPEGCQSTQAPPPPAARVQCFPRPLPLPRGAPLESDAARCETIKGIKLMSLLVRNEQL